MIEQEFYNAAIYCRLSRDDETAHGESTSTYSILPINKYLC